MKIILHLLVNLLASQFLQQQAYLVDQEWFVDLLDLGDQQAKMVHMGCLLEYLVAELDVVQQFFPQLIPMVHLMGHPLPPQLLIPLHALLQWTPQHTRLQILHQ